MSPPAKVPLPHFRASQACWNLNGHRDLWVFATRFATAGWPCYCSRSICYCAAKLRARDVLRRSSPASHTPYQPSRYSRRFCEHRVVAVLDDRIDLPRRVAGERHDRHITCGRERPTPVASCRRATRHLLEDNALPTTSPSNASAPATKSARPSPKNGTIPQTSRQRNQSVCSGLRWALSRYSSSRAIRPSRTVTFMQAGMLNPSPPLTSVPCTTYCWT
jgi:hypothetical protein